MKKLLVFAVALLLCIAIMSPVLAEYGYTSVSKISMAVDFTFRVEFDAHGDPHIITDYPYQSTGADEMVLIYSNENKNEEVMLYYEFDKKYTRLGHSYINGHNTLPEFEDCIKAIRNGDVTLDDTIYIYTTNCNAKVDWILYYSISKKTYIQYDEKTFSQGYNAMGAGGVHKRIYYKDGKMYNCDAYARIDEGDLHIFYDINGNLESAGVSLHKGANKGSYDYDKSTGLFGGKTLTELGLNENDINTPALAAFGSKPDPDKTRAFVTRCYQIVLGRDADKVGLNTWYNELSSGRKTASEIIDRFVNSPEFSGKNYSNEAAVEILYKAMLGRGSDPAGKANWVSKLENGQPFAAVINGFCVSREFKEICASYGINPGSVTVPAQPAASDEKIRAFVQRCYRIILNRDPDEGGMNTWFNELKSRRKAASEIIDRFVNSPEFSGKNYSNGDSVEILYNAMLGRSSDAAGKANWVGKLENGQPFAVIINGFCVSKEFNQICASYGIEPGTVKIQALSGMAEEEALSMLAYKAKAPITKKSETNPTRVEIINPSDTIDMTIGTAVQAVYVNEEKAKSFINRCYSCILGREANAAELNNWIGQMTNGTKTPDQIARGFLFSNEFKGRNVSNEDLVKILYKVYMNRDADPEGLKTWTEKLDNGTSLNDLLNTFSKTSEFKAVVKNMEQ